MRTADLFHAAARTSESAGTLPAPANAGVSPSLTGGSRDLLLWQLADSAFPTGAFGHSNGLEAAWQHGEIRNSAELLTVVQAMLTQARHTALPFIAASFRTVAANMVFCETAGQFAGIDWHCDAFLSNHVANRASRAQGQALLASTERCFGETRLQQLRAHVLQESLPGHLAPVFGFLMAALEIDIQTGARLFVFSQLRGLLSAAVRLNIIGPLEAQGIQHRFAAEAESVARNVDQLTLDDVAQTAPLLDLVQGTQDRIYSRLFQS